MDEPATTPATTIVSFMGAAAGNFRARSRAQRSARSNGLGGPLWLSRPRPLSDHPVGEEVADVADVADVRTT